MPERIGIVVICVRGKNLCACIQNHVREEPFSRRHFEELVWQHVADLLRNPELLLEQYQLRQDQSYGTPEQHEQLRLERKIGALSREEHRLIDAYQSDVIKTRRSQRAVCAHQ